MAEYRVVSIFPDRVILERDGQTLTVRVGTDHKEGPDMQGPSTLSARKGGAPLPVIAPPANIDEIRHQTNALVDLLKANPEFQRSPNERMRRFREAGGSPQ